jgi:photosystem II stability/assembly factor-like uncharacterized protein
MKKGSLFLFVLTVFLITTHGNVLAFNSPLQVGWVIGYDESNTAVILHTKNGGRKWMVQGDNTKWTGYSGEDISAVDELTAWAALASETSGIILHTTNGGAKWTKQTLPEGVDGGIKGIKGLTRHEAWAVSLNGTILHTTDGGKVWKIVEPLDFQINNVNRMDAIGYRDVRTVDRSGKNTGMINANVWIADEDGEENGHLGMIHTLYNGDIWRQEDLPSPLNPPDKFQVHMVSAYSPKVVWAAIWSSGVLYRTVDGGETWNIIDAGIGPNDIDDMCAYSADALWAVQFQGTNTGLIYHVSLEGEEAYVDTFQPVSGSGYTYGGLTCIDDQTALVLGYTIDPPKGIILATNDGGQSWVRQPTPVDDVVFWKVSFVGARR